MSELNKWLFFLDGCFAAATQSYLCFCMKGGLLGPWNQIAVETALENVMIWILSVHYVFFFFILFQTDV